MRYKILDQNGLNFITFSIVDWIDLFTRPVYAEIILESLDYCRANKDLRVHAYVIMPSHAHLIVSTSDQQDLSDVLRSFKSYTAKQILSYIKDKRNIESRRAWLLHHFAFHAKQDSRNSDYQVWQRGNHPFLLYSPKLIRQKLDYIHDNPVRAGIVNEPEHYRFSSAANYFADNGIIEVDMLDDIGLDVSYIS